jgi:DNA topoisomerase-3
MGKTLVLAEKPSVGRDIAKVLNCKGSADGYING